MVNFSLEGKVALVTGAAYGIGLAIAKGYLCDVTDELTRIKPRLEKVGALSVFYNGL